MTKTAFSAGWPGLAAGLLALITGGTACGGRASSLCSADPAPSPSAVLLELTLEANAGGAPFAMGKKLTSPAGVEYTVSLFRFYLSHLELVDRSGAVVPAVLADAQGAPLEYGVTLVDFAKPGSQVLHVLVPPGSYQSLSVSIGVPRDCSGGAGVLNHENASEQRAPLDVDSDMYWGWDPGYTFFKIEGHATTPRGPRAFAFHVGDDKRYTSVSVPASFEVAGPAHHRLALDINRMFVSPSGEQTPDMTGVATPNVVHGGQVADVVANNLKNSMVLSWND